MAGWPVALNGATKRVSAPMSDASWSRSESGAITPRRGGGWVEVGVTRTSKSSDHHATTRRAQAYIFSRAARYSVAVTVAACSIMARLKGSSSSGSMGWPRASPRRSTSRRTPVPHTTPLTSAITGSLSASGNASSTRCPASSRSRPAAPARYRFVQTSRIPSSFLATSLDSSPPVVTSVPNRVRRASARLAALQTVQFTRSRGK